MRRTSRVSLVLATIAVVATTAAGPAAAGKPPKATASKNWAGYIVRSSSVTSVGGTWTVPTVQTPRRHRRDFYSVTWIGIGGVTGASLIQVGTEQDWYQGKAVYRAFFELPPAAATTIASITVDPGDQMSASISNTSGSSFTIRLDDVTTQQSFATTQTYAGPRTSAEWILERPTVARKLAALAPTSDVHFNAGTVNGANANLTASGVVKMAKGHIVLAVPSTPDADANGFLVADGKVAPNAPPP